MTRVRLKNNSDMVGTIVDGIAGLGDVCVRWDNDDSEQIYHIRYSKLETIERSPELGLLDAIDKFQDACNLAIECLRRDVQRAMKKGD